MMKLEQLQPNAAIRGIIPNALVSVVNVQWFGSEALELTYKTPSGKVANELVYRHDEARLELVEQGRPWSFDGDGALFRLVSEAQRIRLAHLFRAIVMDIERSLGFEPVDREFEKLGYDIESRVPSNHAGSGKSRFIEVKGRITGAPTITVTRNEILYSLNKPDDFILAIVEFTDDDSHRAHYLRQPFQREPDFGVTSVNYDFADLLQRARAPNQ